jgi:AcrR family transcriptional regulator
MQEMSAQEALIADAAIRVIVAQGLDAVSVRKVAREAGVAPGTVQYHMGTRDQLLGKALLRSTARQGERVRGLRLPDDSLDRLSRSLLELLPIGEVQREDAALWVIMGAAASTREWLARIYQQELASFQGRLAGWLAEWESASGLPSEPRRISRTARLITALVNGLTLDYLNEAPSPQVAEKISADLRSGLARILRR